MVWGSEAPFRPKWVGSRVAVALPAPEQRAEETRRKRPGVFGGLRYRGPVGKRTAGPGPPRREQPTRLFRRSIAGHQNRERPQKQ